MHDQDTVRIPLRARDGTIRAYALIDADDAAFVNQWRWYLKIRREGGYVARTDYSEGQRTLRLHRELMGLPRVYDGREVDHIDRDPLNCQRSNLRVVTHAGNMQNTPRRIGTSEHRGVVWDERYHKWRARITVNGKRQHLGRFDTEEEAARVSREARARLLPYATD